MPDEICAHCGEAHPPRTAFCPVTGQSMAAASQTARAVEDPANAPRPAEQGVFDLLQQAFELYRKHARAFLTVAAVVFVPGALAHACARATILAPAAVATVALDPVAHTPAHAPVAMGMVAASFGAMLLGLLAAAITGLLFYGVILPLVQGAVALATADRLLGRATRWQDLWAALFRRVGTVLSAIIPAALLTGVGYFFLVVPGVLLSFFFALVPSVALFEGLGGTAALRRSYELVRSDWLRMLLVLLAYIVISWAAQVVAGLFLRGVLGTNLLRDALTLLVLPIPVITSVLLYFDIRRKHEGFDDRTLATELDRFRAAP
ncbi:MAG TPA: hypothetical protein VHU40_01755 [Polyangia bacterium]|nr:hypothetical protein [Polyangia bacterium]